MSVTGAHTAVVTLLARVSNAGLIELGVPVYTADGKITVAGNPALSQAPGKAIPPRGQAAGDRPTETTLQISSPAFFQAYASGDKGTLARYTVPGAHIAGLSGAVTYRRP